MGEDLAAQNQRISENIREYGWHCLHVFPTKESQDKFSYSIGFEESYGSPEIMFLPDRQHRFPWQPGYDDIPAGEPLAIV